MRAAYIIEVQPGDIASLAFAAGVLVAQGVSQGQVIANMLDNIQMVEVPDDFIVDEAQGFELQENGELIEFPVTPDTAESVQADGEFIGEEADPEEVARILATIPEPESQPVYYPQNQQSDFGAGPPPSGNMR